LRISDNISRTAEKFGHLTLLFNQTLPLNSILEFRQRRLAAAL
jgi:hypothetical protein